MNEISPSQREAPWHFVGNFSNSRNRCSHWKKKWNHFDLKSWVSGGTKIRPGIPTNWRIFESTWLDIESQFDPGFRVIGEYLRQIDSQYWGKSTLNIESNWISILSQIDSNILQLFTIPGRILVPPVTQLFRSKWLHFFFKNGWWLAACSARYSSQLVMW